VREKNIQIRGKRVKSRVNSRLNGTSPVLEHHYSILLFHVDPRTRSHHDGPDVHKRNEKTSRREQELYNNNNKQINKQTNGGLSGIITRERKRRILNEEAAVLSDREEYVGNGWGMCEASLGTE
jgi:hypothetical protein